MSNIHSLHLVFNVPEGLEFVAVNDIKESLKDKIPKDVSFLNEPKTGRVHLIVHTNTPSQIVQDIKTATLSSVYSVTLVVSETNIPQTTFDDPQLTYQFTNDVTLTSPWENALKAVSISSSTEAPTFRATFHKGQLKNSAQSQKLAGYIGFAFSQKHPDWKVKLTEYDQEVVALWFRSTEKAMLDRLTSCTEYEKEGPIVLLLGLTIPIKDPKYRNRVHVGRTSLNPCIAYCLARLADPKPGQIILDMCCGTGTIPLEGASKYPNTMWIGSEVNLRTLCVKAKGNLEHSGVSNVDLMVGDGRYLALRSGSIDTVVCDWPWGLREGSYSAIQKLYPKFIKQIGRVLPTHGKALIVTQGQKLFNRVLDYSWSKDMWITDSIIPIGIGGYDVYLYTLIKKEPKPALEGTF
ncbi:putative RNA methylase family UPF0020-domain-containing protein [Phycomyces nitens]|nr:putative RNA methylase family UPF0020-domain-containing protein [Phycomyces nitens]